MDDAYMLTLLARTTPSPVETPLASIAFETRLPLLLVPPRCPVFHRTVPATFQA